MNILFLALPDLGNNTSLFFHNAILFSLEKLDIKLYNLNSPFNISNPVATPSELDILKTPWDIIIVQNSYCFSVYADLLNLIKGIPVLFLSHDKSIKSQISFSKNIRQIFFTKESYYGQFSNTLPPEVYTPITIPIKKYRYKYKRNKEKKNIFLYPSENNFNVYFNTVSYYLSRENHNLFFVSDIIEPVFEKNKTQAKLISREKALKELKYANLVIGAGHDVIQALSMGIPSIILGDSGLGGRVTLQNYQLQKENGFKGRLGGYHDEYIPHDLLYYQIKSTLDADDSNEAELLKEAVLADYSLPQFKKILLQRIQKIIEVDKALKDRNLFPKLKPKLIQRIQFQTIDNISYIVLGNGEGFEIEQSILEIINQCEGKKTILEIKDLNRINTKDFPIFCSNLKTLWESGFLVFF